MRQCMIWVALFLAPGGEAMAQSCPAPQKPPSLRFVTELSPPDYRHQLTRRQISALGDHGRMSPDERHAGLTQAKTAFSVRPNLNFLQLGNGTICAQVAEVEVEWRMALLQVDIAAQYNRASCAYAEIWRHENEHVAIDQKHFMTADRALRTEFGQLIGRLEPFAVRSTPQQAVRDVASRFSASAEPILEKYRRDTTRDNGAIDTPESYQTVGARCKDW